MRLLRDKFIAHLDDEPIFTLPQLDAAKASTVFLYEQLLANENEANAFHDAPDDPEGLYRTRFDEAIAVYAR